MKIIKHVKARVVKEPGKKVIRTLNLKKFPRNQQGILYNLQDTTYEEFRQKLLEEFGIQDYNKSIHDLNDFVAVNPVLVTENHEGTGLFNKVPERKQEEPFNIEGTDIYTVRRALEKLFRIDIKEVSDDKEIRLEVVTQDYFIPFIFVFEHDGYFLYLLTRTGSKGYLKMRGKQDE